MTPPHLDDCQTLLDPLTRIPPDLPFVTMWRPERDPELETATFGQFLERSRKTGALLRESGLGPGQTVLLIQPQGVALMAAFVGAMMIGAVPSILAYPNFKVDPRKYRTGLSGVTRNIGAERIVVDRDFPEALRTLIGGGGLLEIDPARLSSTPGIDSLFRAQTGDVAFLQHSAGTTGLQKGVALSHQRVLRQIRSLTKALEIGPADRIASWLPLYHDMGLIACFILPLMAGLPVAMQSPVDWVMRPASFLHMIQRHGCTLAWIPNFAFQFLARKVAPEERASLDLASMRAFISCSEPIRWRSLEEFRTAFQDLGLRPAALQTSYALAENVFAATQSRLDRPPAPLCVDGAGLRQSHSVRPVASDHPRALPLVSSGSCLESVRALVADPGGALLDEGRVGEILLEGDCLFEGYFNRPDLTARALQGGRYHTGDLGFFWNRELYVLGRMDDTIIVAGKNLDPLDVEEIAHAHVEIADGRAVAFGLENPELGTQDLYVVAEARSEEALAEKGRVALEIRQSIVAQLDVAPRAVQIVPPRWLVKSTAGKPARSTNRRKYLEQFRSSG